MIVTSGMSKLLHSHSKGPSLKIFEANTDVVTKLHMCNDLSKWDNLHLLI